MTHERHAHDTRARPSEAAPAAHGAAGAAAGVSRAGGPPRRGRRRHAGGGLEGGIALGRGRRGRGLCRRALRRTAGARRRAAARHASSSTAATGTHDDIAGAAIAVGACDNDDEAVRFAAAARAAGVPVNVIDKPKFCDFSFRRHRQPLAAGDRHFDRRRGAGVRPGDPRQARGDDPARLRAMGRGGAALAASTCRSPACRSTARRRFWQNVHGASR